MLEERGQEYGPSFRGIRANVAESEKAVGLFRLPDALLPEARDYRLHPVLLDAGFQLLGAILEGSSEQVGESLVYMPIGLKRECPERGRTAFGVGPSCGRKART